MKIRHAAATLLAMTLTGFGQTPGTKLWEFTAGGGIGSSPAMAPDGSIYFGSDAKKLYALNPDGTKRWEFTVGAEIRSAPAIGSDGTLYFGADDNKLYAFGLTPANTGGARAEQVGAR